ncbi:hypothetical protein BC833DRAFT_404525 [Globomyces pollinis-pini]|nr:hypothetical protein BC833DRAFT_404525 [Globomyces pollinis-pini]
MDFNHTISIPKKPQAFHSLPNNWSNSLRLATISSLNINIISPSLNSIAINSSLANLPSQKLISKHPWNIDHHIVAQEAPRYSHWCTIWDVLAIISTHNRIYLFNSPANPEIDKWSTNCDLQPFISLPQNTLKSCCWSNHSTLPFLSTLLAIGSTSGHLVILSYQSMEMISQKLSIHLHNAWLTNILWSDWQLDQNNIQFAYILTGFADGTVSLCKIYNLNGDLSVLKLHDLALADNTPVSFLSFKDFTNADQINIVFSSTITIGFSNRFTIDNIEQAGYFLFVAYAKSNRLFITAIGSQSTTDCYVAPFGTITHGIWYNKNHIRIYTANGIQLNLSYTTQPVSISLVSDETAALRSFLSDGADNDNDSQDEDEDVNGDIDGFGPDKEEFQVYGVLASPHGLYDFISYRLTSFIYMAYLTDHQIKTNISIRPINHPVDTLCVLKTRRLVKYSGNYYCMIYNKNHIPSINN